MIPESIQHAVVIHASPAAVWDALTNIDQMKQWMAVPEMELEVITNWNVGGPILTKAFHHEHFENEGTVLQFEPFRVLRYTHLSSISRLPNLPENYTHFEFRLEPVDEHTALTVTLRGFPTESIYKHLDFYWRVTVGILKDFIEQR